MTGSNEMMTDGVFRERLLFDEVSGVQSEQLPARAERLVHHAKRTPTVSRARRGGSFSRLT